MDVLELTRKLIRFNTVNPPGGEEQCARYLGGLLEDAGFDVHYHELAPGRSNVIARMVRGTGGKTLCLSGHLDTVPPGAAAWQFDPHEGKITRGKIFGRGSSDMKSGIAALTVAAVNASLRMAGHCDLLLLFTAGEESGCLGAHSLSSFGPLPAAGLQIVAEPTSNYPLIGHKGALWLSAVTRGVTAHGSMPEKGVNAIYRAAEAVLELRAFDFGVPPHPVLGHPTLNVGTIAGGMNVNSVPDRAQIGIDIRTIPGLEHDRLLEKLSMVLGPDVELHPSIDSEWLYSNPDNPHVRQVFDIVSEITGEQAALRSVSFFTDGPALASLLGGPPTLILGPGEPQMAHQTDEFCLVEKIEQAVRIYEDIIGRWQP